MKKIDEIVKSINEDDLACKHCGRVVLCGPPCCYDRLYEMWERAEKEVQWLRKVQGKQEKKIQELLKKG